jgi:K+-transporting ATPase ATPase C chain
MRKHVLANLWLLGLTLVGCCVLYPLVLWGIGQTFFAHKAQGSFIDKSGQPADRPEQAVGSRLLAQPFTGDEYFQPRPSAASYNAAASGASNWSASNPLLRDRVARQLGPIAKYATGEKKGQLAGPDVEKWFQGQPGDYVARWANDHAGLAEQWLKDHLDAAARWLQKDPEEVKKDTAQWSKTFFAQYTQKHPGTWPAEQEGKTADGQTLKRIEAAHEGADIQAYLFDAWLQSHPDVDLEKVPADMVMASGSGLDPHITLKNALYQLDRVAGKWAAITRRDVGSVRTEIEGLLRQKAEAPLGGLVGVDLVNVLEVNLALQNRYSTTQRTSVSPSSRR